MVLILIVLIILLIFGLPQVSGNWGFHQYGYAPSSIIAILLVALLVWLLMGRF